MGLQVLAAGTVGCIDVQVEVLRVLCDVQVEVLGVLCDVQVEVSAIVQICVHGSTMKCGVYLSMMGVL